MIIQNIKKLLFLQVYDIQIINRCRVIMEGQIHQITSRVSLSSNDDIINDSSSILWILNLGSTIYQGPLQTMSDKSDDCRTP